MSSMFDAFSCYFFQDSRLDAPSISHRFCQVVDIERPTEWLIFNPYFDKHS